MYLHRCIYLDVYEYRYKNLVYHLSNYVFNSSRYCKSNERPTKEQQRWSNMVASWLKQFSYCWWLPTLHGDTCSYISMTGKQIPGKAWMRCAMMQSSTARCFPKRCGSVMRGNQLIKPFSQGHWGWNLLHNVDCCLGLRCLGFVSPWIESARLNLSSRLEAGDYGVGGNLKLWFSGF